MENSLKYYIKCETVVKATHTDVMFLPLKQATISNTAAMHRGGLLFKKVKFLLEMATTQVLVSLVTCPKHPWPLSNCWRD